MPSSSTKKRKDRKGKKKGKRAAGRRLPTAVQGLLQYLGGSGANLQTSVAPQRSRDVGEPAAASRPRATGADVGETLSRYLAAKTQNLEAMRAAAVGATSAAMVEERLIAKRAAEDLEKKVGMLSVGLKESEVGRKKVIRELQQQKASLMSIGRDQLFENLRGNFGRQDESLRGMQTPSMASGNTPSWAGGSLSGFVTEPSSVDLDEAFNYGGLEGMDDDEMPRRAVSIEEGRGRSIRVPASEASFEGGGGPAVDLYMMNRPLERPIIRDRVPKVPKNAPRSSRAVRAVAGGGVGRSASVPTPTKVNISAADLRAGISAATGLARSRYKLPSSRARYAEVQAALGSTAGSSADLISALKAAGITGLAEV
jgi:hypothetical protein